MQIVTDNLHFLYSGKSSDKDMIKIKKGHFDLVEFIYVYGGDEIFGKANDENDLSKRY